MLIIRRIELESLVFVLVPPPIGWVLVVVITKRRGFFGIDGNFEG